MNTVEVIAKLAV